MNIRPATEGDIPSIVSLLKLSLGESLMPKSEAYWRWKHVQNPFGASPVLLAEEHGEVVGVRAFMRWTWTDGERQYRAVRAVDTATHPAHQGKGIFKKLTLALVDSCKAEGVEFIFNTPNTQSRPGYLKMGWVDAGKLPIQIRPLNVTGMVASLAGRPAKAAGTGYLNPGDLDASMLAALAKNHSHGTGRLVTEQVPGYLKWRYYDVPVVKYFYHAYAPDAVQAVFIGRIKSSRLGNEFRVTEVFSASPEITPAARKALFAFARSQGADYVTCSGTRQPLSLGITLRRGPITTVRPLNDISTSELVDFNRWSPGLGDLELF